MPVDTNIYGHQFVVNGLVYDCDVNFSALLNKEATLYRRYQIGMSKQTINDYGEVVDSISEGNVKGKYIASFNCRLTKIEINLHRVFVREQGRILLDEYKIFCCPTVPVQETDEVWIINEQYQVLRVDRLSKKERLHHLELSVKRLDLT